MRYVVAEEQKTHILEDIYRQNRGFVHLSTPVFESFGNGEQFSTPMLEMWVSSGKGGTGADGEISKSVLTKRRICAILFYMQIPAQGPLAQLVRAPGS